jgi:hypothetical protein
MTDLEMLQKARLEGFRKARIGEYGTHTICRHGKIKNNGGKKHKCIRYALISAALESGVEQREKEGVWTG